jgi:hypothetical protein
MFSAFVEFNEVPLPGIVFAVSLSCMTGCLIPQGIDVVLRLSRRIGVEKAFLSLPEVYIEEGDNGVKMGIKVVKIV